MTMTDSLNRRRYITMSIHCSFTYVTQTHLTLTVTISNVWYTAKKKWSTSSIPILELYWQTTSMKRTSCSVSLGYLNVCENIEASTMFSGDPTTTPTPGHKSYNALNKNGIPGLPSPGRTRTQKKLNTPSPLDEAWTAQKAQRWRCIYVTSSAVKFQWRGHGYKNLKNNPEETEIAWRWISS